jgi:hypothetical protein
LKKKKHHLCLKKKMGNSHSHHDHAQEIIKAWLRDSSEHNTEQLRELWKIYDTEGDGMLNEHEGKQFLRDVWEAHSQVTGVSVKSHFPKDLSENVALKMTFHSIADEGTLPPTLYISSHILLFFSFSFSISPDMFYIFQKNDSPFFFFFFRIIRWKAVLGILLAIYESRQRKTSCWTRRKPHSPP